jgi:hypothetical protein
VASCHTQLSRALNILSERITVPQVRSLYRLTLWTGRCFARATFLTCGCLQVGSRNQTSKAAQGCCASGWFNLASSLVIVVPAVARAVGTAGAKAMASMTNATAEIVAAISLNITRGYSRSNDLTHYVKL